VAFEDNKILVCCDNLVRRDDSPTTWSCTSPPAGGVVHLDTLIDNLRSTLWRGITPSQTDIEYEAASNTNIRWLAVFNHNIGGLDCRFSYRNGSWKKAYQWTAPFDDFILMFYEDLTGYPHFRFRINSPTTPPQIGQLIFGDEFVELDAGIGRPYQTEYISDSLLGRPHGEYWHREKRGNGIKLWDIPVPLAESANWDDIETIWDNTDGPERAFAIATGQHQRTVTGFNAMSGKDGYLYYPVNLVEWDKPVLPKKEHYADAVFEGRLRWREVL
jgi:hypothetical protein